MEDQEISEPPPSHKTLSPCPLQGYFPRSQGEPGVWSGDSGVTILAPPLVVEAPGFRDAWRPLRRRQVGLVFFRLRVALVFTKAAKRGGFPSSNTGGPGASGLPEPQTPGGQSKRTASIPVSPKNLIPSPLGISRCLFLRRLQASKTAPDVAASGMPALSGQREKRMESIIPCNTARCWLNWSGWQAAMKL